MKWYRSRRFVCKLVSRQVCRRNIILLLTKVIAVCKYFSRQVCRLTVMMIGSMQLVFWPAAGVGAEAATVGFRSGDKGTHTSRTMMLAELSAVLAATTHDANRSDYASAIIEANCLGKPTVATRRLTNQRLGELYALDANVPLFRILRNLWTVDESGRPLLALLAALARDPLLVATAPAVVPLSPGSEFQRGPMRESLRAAVAGRLNDAILDKVARNASSSWTQSGHLEGRTFKFRKAVKATPASVAFALYLGHAVGFRGEELFSSGWIAALDCTLASARDLALSAKRLGLIDLRLAGNVVELRLDRLDPWRGRI